MVLTRICSVRVIAGSRPADDSHVDRSDSIEVCRGVCLLEATQPGTNFTSRVCINGEQNNVLQGRGFLPKFSNESSSSESSLARV
jgi:hypothetical protein